MSKHQDIGQKRLFTRTIKSVIGIIYASNHKTYKLDRREKFENFKASGTAIFLRFFLRQYCRDHCEADSQ